MRTDEEARAMTERTMALAALGGVIFSDELPEVVGAAMAEMMSIFLRSHVIANDPRTEHEMREAVFEQWIATVRNLVLIRDRPAGGMQ